MSMPTSASRPENPRLSLRLGAILALRALPAGNKAQVLAAYLHQYEQALGSWHAFHLHGHLGLNTL